MLKQFNAIVNEILDFVCVKVRDKIGRIKTVTVLIKSQYPNIMWYSSTCKCVICHKTEVAVPLKVGVIISVFLFKYCNSEILSCEQ
jgi:hypothetical protein